MSLYEPFNPNAPLIQPDPLRLLPKKLRNMVLVYKAAVESGLIDPIEKPAVPQVTAPGQESDEESEVLDPAAPAGGLPLLSPAGD